MQKIKNALIGLAVAALAPAAQAQVAACPTGAPTTTVAGPDITSNTSWSGHVLLQGPVFVKNNAVLTIAPGTVIRGQPRSGPVVSGQTAGTPGVIVVTQSGRIIANGSPTNPITMTTAAVDNDNNNIPDDLDGNNFEDAYPGFDPSQLPALVPDATPTWYDDTCTTAPLAPLDAAGNSNVALWGGLVVLGEAPTNLANANGQGYGIGTVEGLTVPGFPAADAAFGGNLPNDNSGSLSYISIRHAGDEIGEGNELNGLTLGGVGAGTRISYIEVYANFDDGVEWFGGTVNGDHLAVFFVGDDSFDVDNGYTGVNQYLVTFQPFFNENDGQVYGSASGDKLLEGDGEDYRPDNTALNDNVNTRERVNDSIDDKRPWPFSSFAFYNVTAIGSLIETGNDFTPTSVNAANIGWQYRNGGAGDLFNSVILNVSDTGFEGLTSGVPGFTAADHMTNGLTRIVCTTMDNVNGTWSQTFTGGVPNPPTSTVLTAAESAALENGNLLSQRLGGLVSGTTNSLNSYNPSNFSLANSDITFNPVGDVNGKLIAGLKPAPIDPRPVSSFGSPVAGCAAPPRTGVDPSPLYRGAFQTGAPLWTNTWTSLDQGGLL